MVEPRIGLIVGREWSFPPAFIDAIKQRRAGVVAEYASLDATRMTYRVDVDSVQLGNGALDSRFVVPSGDTSVVRLPIRFTYRGLGEAGRQILSTGSVNYRVRGDFTVVTPIGNFTRPYDQTGRFNSVSGVDR